MSDKRFTGAMKEEVETMCRKRIEGAGLTPGKGAKALRKEYDILMGAAAAINAVFGPGDDGTLSKEVPPSWIIYAMTGRSVFDKPKLAVPEGIASRCACGHTGGASGTDHAGFLGHGACSRCECAKFTWKHFLKDEKVKA